MKVLAFSTMFNGSLRTFLAVFIDLWLCLFTTKLFSAIHSNPRTSIQKGKGRPSFLMFNVINFSLWRNLS
jgi:hypothetical protein